MELVDSVRMDSRERFSKALGRLVDLCSVSCWIVGFEAEVVRQLVADGKTVNAEALPTEILRVLSALNVTRFCTNTELQPYLKGGAREILFDALQNLIHVMFPHDRDNQSQCREVLLQHVDSGYK